MGNNFTKISVLALIMGLSVSLTGCGKGTGDPVGFDGDTPPVFKVTLSPKTGWYDTYFDLYTLTGKSNR
ncbi:MAG: hypothetical protein GY771_08215, partial [bacterium]|nr:hypothetical protein [bacterium]